MDEETKQCYCEKCHKTMNDDNFYTSNNLEKYPNGGKLNICKKCLTMHVDNWNPETYLWILQEIDVPYVPDEWNKLLAKYAKDKSKLTGVTILGRYLSKMKLKQWKDYRWGDNQHIQDLNNLKIEQSMKRQGYSAAEIHSAIAINSVDLPTEELKEPPNVGVEEFSAPVDYFGASPQDDFDMGLTDEDSTYLRLKWGKTYKPEEWVRLEQLYEEMMSSYDIQSAGHIDTLKLVCKTSLKANQLLDIGDVDGAQKMVKMYDGLMRSGKFTAAQNKEESGEFVNSISELIELCEKEGYIERYYIDTPNDKIDVAIKDMQRYTKTLIEEETNLTSLLDLAIKNNMKEDESDVEDTDEIIFDDIDEVEKELTTEDFTEFYDFLDETEEANNSIFEALEKGDL